MMQYGDEGRRAEALANGLLMLGLSRAFGDRELVIMCEEFIHAMERGDTEVAASIDQQILARAEAIRNAIPE
jgi:hypothetical protein